MITAVLCEVREISGRVRYDRSRRIVKFTFSVTDDTATAECRLDKGAFESCKLSNFFIYNVRSLLNG